MDLNRISNKNKAIKENKIISYFNQGEERKGIQLLYKNVFPNLKAYILRNNGDLQNAEDLFHDAVLKLILKIRNAEISPEKDISGYLFIMAKNEWISKSRREKKMHLTSETSDFEHAGTVEIDTDKKEKAELMNQMLSSLGEMCMNLLKLTFYLDHSLAEAAEKLKISNASVAKTYQYRCKKKLFDAVRNNEAFKEIMQL